MLQLQNIHKEYTTGDFTQVALDDISVSFRDNEFVSVLGPSGSGKTTLLNIIGGLDHYDSGNLIIDGVSTEDYKDRDWDAFRNNRIGFVFQNYDLIPHQSVLSNVELALTLSGISREERRERAREALVNVGLEEHIDKKPSQLSGGQMQRVAIARALINDPEIVLADEPTGALDSKTSTQIMDLLTEIARDRLVVMVTHNPDLAEEYSTRIVNLADGHIINDTDPYNPTLDEMGLSEKPTRRTSMSFLTALSLSANNLLSKKGRTIMTAIAGSIGIIGIALILSLSNGVNDYIEDIEEDTLSVYPLQVTSTGFDMTSIMSSGMDLAPSPGGGGGSNSNDKDNDDATTNTVGESDMITSMFSSISSNDLASLKSFLDSDECDIDQYVTSIEYTYNVTPQVYSADTSDGVRQINPDTTFSSLGFSSDSSTNSLMSTTMSTDVFTEMVSNTTLIEEQYDVVAGHWPENYDECVIVLTSEGDITDFTAYVLGFRDPNLLQDMVRQFMNEEEIQIPDDELRVTYDDLMGIDMKLVNAADYYQYDEDYGVWVDKSGDDEYMSSVIANSEDIVISGIVQPRPGATASSLTAGVYYTPALTQHIIDEAASTQIVQDQLNDPSVDVFTGRSFADIEEENDESAFDMDSILSFDSDALNSTFNIDTSNIAGDMSALGSDLDIDTSDLGSALDSSALGSALDSSDLGSALDTSDLGSALDTSGLGSALDTSGLGSAFNLDMSDLASSLDLDMSSLLSGLDMDLGLDMSALGADMDLSFEDMPMPEINMDDLLATVGDSALSVNQDALIEAASVSMTGYLNDIGTIMAENPDIDPADQNALLRIYLDSPDAQAIMATYVPQVVDTSAMMTSMQESLQQSLQTYMQTSLQSYLNQAMDTYMGQIQSTIESQMQTAIESQMQSVMDQMQSSIESQMQTAVAQMMNTYTAQIQSSIESQVQDAISQMMSSYAGQISSAIESQVQGALEDSISDLTDNVSAAAGLDPDAFADAFDFNLDEGELTDLIMSFLNSDDTTYDSNLTKLGYADTDKPSGIDIYPSNFENKEKVTDILDDYNNRMESSGQDDKTITYTDIVGTLMSSVTTIVDMVSYILIAFVAISLVVSSIMIGVITYISVLERRKEIGILRAVGASKGDVSRVFNAETIIEGLIAGLLGVGVTALLCIPINAIVNMIFEVPNVAQFPIAAAVILVLISVALTFIAGLIPSSSASRKDPVEALRSE